MLGKIQISILWRISQLEKTLYNPKNNHTAKTSHNNPQKHSKLEQPESSRKQQITREPLVGHKSQKTKCPPKLINKPKQSQSSNSRTRRNSNKKESIFSHFFFPIGANLTTCLLVFTLIVIQIQKESIFCCLQYRWWIIASNEFLCFSFEVNHFFSFLRCQAKEMFPLPQTESS